MMSVQGAPLRTSVRFIPSSENQKCTTKPPEIAQEESLRTGILTVLSMFPSRCRWPRCSSSGLDSNIWCGLQKIRALGPDDSCGYVTWLLPFGVAESGAPSPAGRSSEKPGRWPGGPLSCESSADPTRLHPVDFKDRARPRSWPLAAASLINEI